MASSRHRTSVGRKVFALAAALFCGIAVAEDFSQWARSADLYLNTTPDGAHVEGMVTGFPVLVRLNAANFTFAEARADGRDLRFSKGGLTPLPFQVERWDAAKSLAEIWVKVDTIRGNDGEQKISMHWGNPSAGDPPVAGPVFDSADGYLAVHHLGSGPGSRPNAVPGYQAAAPQSYGGDEDRPGIIGLCDSLGAIPGSEEYLGMYDGFTETAQGFTFSVWAYPVDMGKDAALLSIGNGPGLDNIHIKRSGTTTGLTLDVYNVSAKSQALFASNVLLLNQWQHIAVTIAGLEAKIYRNGALVGSRTLTQPVSASRRAFNYLGKSNWSLDAYYAGKLDEPRISKRARSADWIKLSHANQSAAQSLVAFQKPVPPISCAATFAPPGDTLLDEGSFLELSAQADCASAYTWSVVSGPAPKLLDPDVKVLQMTLPRVLADTGIVLLFSGRFGDTLKTRQVKVGIRESVPDPVFNFTAPISWNGIDSVLIRPNVSNIADIRASRDSVLNFSWTLEGMDLDTAWREGALLLLKAPASGRLNVGLCMDNGGLASCQELPVTVDLGTGILRRAAAKDGISSRRFRDAAGRWHPPDGPGRGFPGSGAPRFRY